MSDSGNSDPLGHGLLSKRVEESELALLSMPAEPFDPGAVIPGLHWVVSGQGSSEAHARFFASLINRTSKTSASFMLPTESGRVQRKGKGIGWLLFSQGFSHNAVAATRSWPEAVDTIRVLVTAATPEALEEAGHSSRAKALRELQDSGVQLVPMRGQGEYTILIRTIGPLCGFYSALRLAIRAGSAVEPPDNDSLLNLRAAANEEWSANGALLTEEWINGASLNTVGPMGDCIQNLILKRLEGIYRDPSPVRDLLAYAHGFFQRETLRKRPQWLLGSPDEITSTLTERFSEMNTASGIFCRVVTSPYGWPLSLFYYEMLFNRILLQAVRQLGVDQCNWPGKGADGPLYQWDEGI